jgi:GNAT superfamily N-acetyltransferase
MEDTKAAADAVTSSEAQTSAEPSDKQPAPAEPSDKQPAPAEPSDKQPAPAEPSDKQQPAPEPSDEQPAPADGTLLAGSIVRVHSLVGRQELNGRRGHVLPNMSQEGRVGVAIDGLVQPLALKPANVEQVAPSTGSDTVLVLVGTTSLVTEQFVYAVSEMVNGAYGRRRLSPREVVQRLAMGDDGEDANRVLHLGWRDGTLVGCCSSTMRVGWAPHGCGHWGLLSVAEEAQGTGVASALVAAAEERLRAAGLGFVQMEYDFEAGDPLSLRLHKWYEGTLGFTALSGRPPPTEPGESEWRSCRKCLLEGARLRGDDEDEDDEDDDEDDEDEDADEDADADEDEEDEDEAEEEKAEEEGKDKDKDEDSDVDVVDVVDVQDAAPSLAHGADAASDSRPATR